MLQVDSVLQSDHVLFLPVLPGVSAPTSTLAYPETIYFTSDSEAGGFTCTDWTSPGAPGDGVRPHSIRWPSIANDALQGVATSAAHDARTNGRLGPECRDF